MKKIVFHVSGTMRFGNQPAFYRWFPMGRAQHFGTGQAFPAGLLFYEPFILKRNFNQMIERSPERVIEIAVKGMLPKGPLGRQMYRKLKVFAGSEHKHEAQQPQPLDI